MKPVKNIGFQDVNGSGNITWLGPCIPCLGIQTGDNLNAVVFTIAEKVCALAAPLDLSSLTLQCALDIIGTQEPANRTLSNVLQLLIDNECKLKDLIDNIQVQIDGQSAKTLTLNLGCLKQVDSYGNQLPYDEQSVLQLLLNNVCATNTTLTALSGKYTQLADRLDSLVIPSGDEAVVTTCIQADTLPVSVAVSHLANDYCEYKQDVGSIAQIQTAIARQTARFNGLMAGVPGWVVPSDPAHFSLAQSINNIWLLLSNIDVRSLAVESCCAGSCDSLSVGFITAIEGSSVILTFSTGAGTRIPVGYVDNGSTISITDSLGITTGTIPLIITQGGDSEPIDLSMFTIGQVLSFDLDVKMKSATDSCQKCVSKDVKYINAGCCVLTNNGSTPVTLIYSSLI